LVGLAGVAMLGEVVWLSVHLHSRRQGTVASDDAESAAGAFARVPRSPTGGVRTPTAARTADWPTAVAANDNQEPAPTVTAIGVGEPDGAGGVGAAGPATSERGPAQSDAATRSLALAGRAQRTDTVWQVGGADGGRADGSLCGGKTCAPDQFCCGPPECGRCTSRAAGPRCPNSCP
jgi:hypothetical protein